MTVSLTLTPSQLDAIASQVAAKMAPVATDRPYTIPQAADRLGLCADTVRIRVKAGQIARLPVSATGSRVLIPAAEINRLLEPQ